jgi:hypothetical protein
LRADETIGLVLCDLGAGTSIVGVAICRPQHVGAKLDMAFRLAQELIELVFELGVLQFVQGLLVKLDTPHLYRQHLGQKIFKPLGVQREAALPARPYVRPARFVRFMHSVAMGRTCFVHFTILHRHSIQRLKSEFRFRIQARTLSNEVARDMLSVPAMRRLRDGE